MTKDVTWTIENERKGQRGEFCPSLLGTLGVTFWGSMLSGKDVSRAGKVALKAGEAFWCFLIL